MEHAVEFIALLLTGFILLVNYFGLRNLNYWKIRGVAGPKPIPVLGTHKDILLSRVPSPVYFRRLYEEFSNEPFVGLSIATRQNLMIRDPELIKHVLTKDFEHFHDRDQPYHEDADPLSANLFSMEGVRWRNLRIKLSPTFTSGKIKRMFPLMKDCGKRLVQVLDAHASGEEVVELKDVLGRFSTDVIGSCAFGINCNSLEHPDSEFRKQGMKVFETSLCNKLRFAFLLPFPKVAFLHWLLSRGSVERFFNATIKESVDYREKNKVKRGDFLDLLIEINKNEKIVDNDISVIEDPFLHVPVSTSSDEFKFTEKLMAAQSFVFFIAGFETTSSTITFCLLELANNSEIQNKVRADIDVALQKHGSLTYEAIADMHYLDKVLSETLRKYPPLATLVRVCKKPYRIPGSELVLEKGTGITIPVVGLHYDPSIYPDPERFDPERFSPEAKVERHSYSYLPFGEGPRICIGMRFGQVEAKLGLATLLSKYEFRPSPLTRYPVQYAKGAFVVTNADGCNLFIKKRAS